jgi:cytoskeletal protein RodZ
LPSARRRPWRPGRWLAAACVAGLGLLAVAQIYEPARRQTPIAPTAPAAPTPAVQPSAGRQGAVAPAPSAPSAPTAAVAPPASPPALAKAEPPPPALAMPPAPEAFPAVAAPAPPPPPAPSSVVVEQRQRDEAAADQTAARSAVMQAPAARLAAPLAAPTGAESLGGAPPSPAVRLRAAAAAGRTAEVEALLAHGVPVDAVDANGDTALMKSIQADQPAVAALLRRQGASLDLRNHAGETARDMARAKGDAALDQAIGPGPQVDLPSARPQPNKPGS